MGEILRSDTRFSERNWTAKLATACLAYNANVNRVTGKSPFEAVFGRKVLLPVDCIFPTKLVKERSWSSQIEEFKLRLHDMFEQMCKQQQSHFDISNRNYQGRSKLEFKEKDTVYFFMTQLNHPISRKLTTRWVGPFEIQKVVSDSLVVIYPKGDWAFNKRQIATITNRLRKVDSGFVDPLPGLDKFDLDNIHPSTEDVLEQITSEGFASQQTVSKNAVPFHLIEDEKDSGVGLTPMGIVQQHLDEPQSNGLNSSVLHGNAENATLQNALNVQNDMQNALDVQSSVLNAPRMQPQRTAKEAARHLIAGYASKYRRGRRKQ